MPDMEPATVSLNLDGNFASQAGAMTAAGDRLSDTMERMGHAMGAVKGPDLGGNLPAFSGASAADFKRSKWEQGWKPPPPVPSPPSGAAGAGAAGGKAAGAAGTAGLTGLDGGLKLIARSAGISRAALAALGTAAALEATKLAIGYRGMAMLQAITLRTSMQIRQLFRGVDPMPLVRAYDRFTQLFNKSSATGQYLTGLFSRIFNALFGGVEKAEPAAERLFKQLIIGAQEVEIAWLELRIAALPLTKAIGDLWSEVSKSPLGDMIDDASSAGTGFKLLADMIDLATGALRGFKAVKDSLGGKEGGLAQLGTNAKLNLGAISQAQYEQERRENFAGGKTWNPKGGGTGFAPVGAGFAVPTAPNTGGAPIGASGKASGEAYGDGVAAGMRSKMGDVGAAGGEVAGAADEGFRREAKINSPSRVAYDSASWIPAGVADALDDGRSDVQAAADRSLVPKMPSGSTVAARAFADRGSASSSGGAAPRLGSGAQVVVQHVWPAGVDRARRADIEDAAAGGTTRALRAWALELGVPR